MATGTAGNTVFTAIPVGEDFYMSFPTNRFYHYIAQGDIRTITFKLYDARLVANAADPEAAALILEKNDQPYDVDSNPNGAPTLFVKSDKAIKILVQSAVLDAWAVDQDATGSTTMFRGELYGYLHLTVGGAETDEFAVLSPAPMTGSMVLTADIEPLVGVWDGYLYPADGRVQPALAITAPSQLRLAGDP